MVYFDTPPTANNFYTNVHGRGRVVSSKGKAWRESAGKQLMTQHPKHIPGPVNIDILVEDSGRFDLDGICKPSLDLLVGYGLIEDDKRSIVRHIGLDWDGSIKGVQVTITPLAA